ncbi:hypothetical protein IAT40_007404 [Kwoniella sp. CBS 6097]
MANKSGSPDASPELLAHCSLPQETPVPEVSMVEESTVTGVTFTPELWMQRRHWALDVLKKEGVRSVLDIGCGPGSLLETLVIPPTTIREPPIRVSKGDQSGEGQLPSPADSGDEDVGGSGREVFLQRLGGLDVSQSVIKSALATITPPSPDSNFPPTQPRWEPMSTELWLGGIEKYNAHLEGFEAITLLEVIEHLEPDVLDRFGVVTFGTYRPKLLLITTPNFDFNAKFPRAEEQDFAKKGFVDPTGRTDRVFRHSDHKLEMTNAEFRNWAEAEAANWGYDVEVSGVGTSSQPSYYPSTDPSQPLQPIYATQTAIFRLSTGLPLRSPRSVRTTQLPFMPSSSESSHSHKLAGKFVHPVSHPGDGKRRSPEDVRKTVRECFERWNVGEVSLDEVWGVYEVSGRCAGSKRYLVSSLGGWGDCEALPLGEGAEADKNEFEVTRVRGRGLSVKWNNLTPRSGEEGKTQEQWDQPAGRSSAASQPSEKTGGW